MWRVAWGGWAGRGGARLGRATLQPLSPTPHPTCAAQIYTWKLRQLHAQPRALDVGGGGGDPAIPLLADPPMLQASGLGAGRHSRDQGHDLAQTPPA